MENLDASDAARVALAACFGLFAASGAAGTTNQTAAAARVIRNVDRPSSDLVRKIAEGRRYRAESRSPKLLDSSSP